MHAGICTECSCATSSEVVVLDYRRQVLDQSSGGHFSPIKGYHVERNMVLLVDVAIFNDTPHWVKLSRRSDASNVWISP